jgi:hypothetical protein
MVEEEILQFCCAVSARELKKDFSFVKKVIFCVRERFGCIGILVLNGIFSSPLFCTSSFDSEISS